MYEHKRVILALGIQVRKIISLGMYLETSQATSHWALERLAPKSSGTPPRLLAGRFGRPTVSEYQADGC
jgi:hypothetical protein